MTKLWPICRRKTDPLRVNNSDSSKLRQRRLTRRTSWQMSSQTHQQRSLQQCKTTTEVLLTPCMVTIRKRDKLLTKLVDLRPWDTRLIHLETLAWMLSIIRTTTTTSIQHTTGNLRRTRRKHRRVWTSSSPKEGQSTPMIIMAQARAKCSRRYESVLKLCQRSGL